MSQCSLSSEHSIVVTWTFFFEIVFLGWIFKIVFVYQVVTTMKDIDSLFSQKLESQGWTLFEVGDLLGTWSDNNFVARVSKRLEALADDTMQLRWAVLVKSCRSMMQDRARALFTVGQLALHQHQSLPQLRMGEFALEYVNFHKYLDHNLRYEWRLENPKATTGLLLPCARV